MAILPNVLYEFLRELSKLSPNVDLQSLATLAGTNTVAAAKIIHHSLSIYRLLKKIPSLSVAKSMEDLVGNTPTLELQRFAQSSNAPAKLLAKLEFCNPGCSSADRLWVVRIAAAEHDGLLQPDSLIVAAVREQEAASLAWLGASRGFRVHLCMAADTNPTVQEYIRLYGAQLTLDEHPVEKAQELLRTMPGAVSLPSYSPSHHAQIHYHTTGPELWNATQGKIDVLVGSAADPDILSGVGQYLKEKNENLRVVAVRLTPDGVSSQQELVSISPDTPPLLSIYDELIAVSEQDARRTMSQLAQTEGLLAGPISAAVSHAAVQLSQRTEYAGKTIAILFPDSTNNFCSHFPAHSSIF